MSITRRRSMKLYQMQQREASYARMLLQPKKGHLLHKISPESPVSLDVATAESRPFASMGPVLVATMVQGDIGSVSKKLHPFFTKGDGPELLSSPPTKEVPTTLQTVSVEHSVPEPSAGSRKKKRKSDICPPEDLSEPKESRRKRRSIRQSSNGAILNHLTKPDQEASASSIPAAEEAVHKSPTPPLRKLSSKPSERDGPVAIIAKLEAISSHVTGLGTLLQPKKVLKFNPKTGTLGPPPPKPMIRPSRIVLIKYGKDDEQKKELGGKIIRILEGSLAPQQAARTPHTSLNKETPEPKLPSTSGLLKVPHPFFTGKPRPAPEAGKSDYPIKPLTERRTILTSTPISPKKPRRSLAPGKAVELGRRSTVTKISGAMHPLWPPQGMAHVRGGDPVCPKAAASACESRSRKSKGAVVTVAPRESVLRHLVDSMDLQMVRNSLPVDEDHFTPAPVELRLPRRHFESGRKLQKRIRPHLQTRFKEAYDYDESCSSVDELSSQPLRIHPAISRIYRSLRTQLSAYDRSCCENLPWAQKYAPVNAAQVLQVGKEALLLSQWLQALRVQSVETGGSECDRGKGKSESAPIKKRRKKKLAGFVVESDDEVSEMDEISDPEDSWTSPAGLRLHKKSVIRGGDMAVKGSKDQGRLANAIILSGPHGSGKTAAVYAVAKELDFEVFEINSSSRRSGKDILEKVGDMTRNHLVQHSHVEPTSVDTDEVANDIISGKQGMMTAFFKPRAAAQGKKQQRKVTKDNSKNAFKTPTAKTQKQSLILLEEVDVLYEEDKQFWATLMGLVAQSKRPFIMTCYDESLVPVQALSLHGIFRFSPAPSNLAVDLCILIAANEGHALQRSAVEALYCSRNKDLRATITELNYWCQIGIGDRRGGFDWFYLRWPKGSDLDENGDVVRVISEDTYQKGMGWFARDLIVTAASSLDAEEEAKRQIWDAWRLDIGDWCNNMDVKAWALGEYRFKPSSITRSATLAAYDAFCGSMSDADVCAGGAYGTQLRELIDPTLPDLPSIVREDFILGQTLLEAESLVRQASPNTVISTSLRSLARAVLHNTTAEANASVEEPPFEPVDEKRAICILDASFRTYSHQLTRHDLAAAFDPIAVSPKGASTAYLDPSVFDRTLSLVVLDVAPWIRGIVEYEHRLMQKRLKLSNLLSQGGKRKRMRNTRSALSALEGGERRMTRREKHFGDCLTMGHVMRTGGKAWAEAVLGSEAEESIAPSSPISSDDGLLQ